MAHTHRKAFPNLQAYFEAPGAPSQGEFAARVKMSESFLSEILSGKSRPGFLLALRIAEKANIPVESLAAGSAHAAQRS